MLFLPQRAQRKKRKVRNDLQSRLCELGDNFASFAVYNFLTYLQTKIIFNKL